jgi:hypothetical protein
MKLRSAWLLLLPLALLAGCGDKPLTEFKDPAGKFKASFPGTPKQSSTPGRNNIQVQMFGAETFSGAYFVSYYDSPAPIPGDAEFQKNALTEEVKGIFSAQPNGKIQSSNPIKLQGKHEGLDFVGTTSRPKANTNIRGRSYIVGNRVYITFVLTAAERANAESTTKFLDSF